MVAMKKTCKTSIENKVLDKYLADIGKYNPLPAEQEVELATRIHQNETAALRKLVESNLRFVVTVAKEYQGQGLPLMDLISEGNFGLIKAATRFDETRGVKFISYAVWWIRQSILQALSEHSRLIRIPLNHIGSINKITKTIEKLEHQYERQPNLSEIANSLEINDTAVADTIKITKRHQSLHSTDLENEGSTLLDTIENENQDKPYKHLVLESFKEEITEALDSLKERERYVLQMYFGIDQEYSLSLKDIGDEFQVTRERIRQIKDLAISRISKSKSKKSLQTYLGEI